MKVADALSCSICRHTHVDGLWMVYRKSPQNPKQALVWGSLVTSCHLPVLFGLCTDLHRWRVQIEVQEGDEKPLFSSLILGSETPPFWSFRSSIPCLVIWTVAHLANAWVLLFDFLSEQKEQVEESGVVDSADVQAPTHLQPMKFQGSSWKHWVSMPFFQWYNGKCFPRRLPVLRFLDQLHWGKKWTNLQLDQIKWAQVDSHTNFIPISFWHLRLEAYRAGWCAPVWSCMPKQSKSQPPLLYAWNSLYFSSLKEIPVTAAVRGCAHMLFASPRASFASMGRSLRYQSLLPSARSAARGWHGMTAVKTCGFAIRTSCYCSDWYWLILRQLSRLSNVACLIHPDRMMLHQPPVLPINWKLHGLKGRKTPVW